MKRNNKLVFRIAKIAFSVIMIAIAALCFGLVFSASGECKDGSVLLEESAFLAPIQTTLDAGLLQNEGAESSIRRAVPIIRKPILYSDALCVSEEHPIDNPYAALNPTAEEKELLARMACSEARGEPFEGQVAVIQVALNRYMHDAYSGTISEILLAPYQFAVGDTYSRQQMDAVEEALSGYPALNLNTDVVYFSTGCLTYGSYHSTIGGHVFRTYQ